GSEAVYALAGMGALAASVLGAPISTTLIVFELTGNWQVGIAVMTAVSLSSALSSTLVDRSFFLTQLERRGKHVAAGPQAYLLAMQRVSAVMRSTADPKTPQMDVLEELLDQGLAVDRTASLEAAMPLFAASEQNCLAVTISRPDDAGREIVGVLHYLDALQAYNRALTATVAEEHA
ncbi:MAG: chloride channel protein, partial [Mangrovicoccus sp.]|nr:chloride channel protein [Mangrovicoccus sp.]